MIKIFMSNCDKNFVTAIYFLSIFLAQLCLGSASSFINEKERCEEINIPMCRGIGYNFTSMPNQMHHDTQDEAGLEVHQFWPLVEIQCSEDLRFFLCSMYAPICIENYHGKLPACRSVCERAKAGCAPIMVSYGFAWPERMACENFPVYGDQEHLCMDSKERTSDSRQHFGSSLPKTQLSINSKDNGKEIPKDKSSKPPFNKSRPFSRPREKELDFRGISSGAGLNFGNADCKCECRSPMMMIQDIMDRRVYNRVETGGVANCVIGCQGVFFSKTEKDMAVFWIGIAAIICCVCTTLTILTFITDMDRFKYPERCIIFLSACYLMVSIGYIIRSYIGHEQIACDGPMIRYPGISGPAPAPCVIVFLLIYFFGMASSVWFVILTLTWFLAAGLKWGNEAIAGYSQYFHLLAWFLPTVKSITILAMGAVDGDPFTGICFVGNQNLSNLRGFVIIPLCVYLGLGFFFLLAGFISLLRIRSVIRQQARVKTDKLEKLMMRILMFSILYILPGTIVVGCYFYEQHYRHTWQRHHNCLCSVPSEKPYYLIFLLKYVMFLVVGITSGFWILSGKTVDSWVRFCARVCCCSSSGSSRSASQLIAGSQFAINNPRNCKQQQITAASHALHIGSTVHSKQIPLSHV